MDNSLSMTRLKRKASDSWPSIDSSEARRSRLPRSSESLAPEGLPILCLSEDSPATWGYGSCGQDGALRLFSVEKLLNTSSSPSIDLYEWRDLHSWPRGGTYVATGPRCPPGMPCYAAISHVWEATAAVQRRSMAAKRPLMIDTGHDEPHEVSWLGLVQAATAARNLKCEYLWLDLMCLNQRSTMDKEMQIKNMHKIYCNASAVIVMFGGIAAAQPLDELSTWINRAWTLQEATSCHEMWGLVEWKYSGSFSSWKNPIKIMKLEGDVGILELGTLVQVEPGQRLGKGYLAPGGKRMFWRGEKEIEIDLPVNCLGSELSAISTLESAMNSRRRGFWNDDVREGNVGSIEWGSSGEEEGAENDGGDWLSGEDDGDNDDPWEDISDDEITLEEDDGNAGGRGDAVGVEDCGSHRGGGNHREEGSDDYNSVNSGTDLNISEESTVRVLHGAAWRSMWLRTSTKPQDMVFSTMHLLGVTIEVDYQRSLEELVFDLVDKTSTIPAWLTIGYDIPVNPKSGLIPVLPTFTPNSVPTYIVDGKPQSAADVVCEDYWCYKFDLAFLSSSIADGHLICVRAMDVKFASMPQKSADNGLFLESEVHLSSTDYDLVASCRFRGRIGKVVVIVGKRMVRHDYTRWEPGREPLVFFLNRNENGTWQKFGAGILYLPDLARIERRHLRVGGSPGAEFKECDCGKESRRKASRANPPPSPENLIELLKEACWSHDEKTVRRLLDMGVDVNARLEGQASILEAACTSGNGRIVELLLENGADPNFQREKVGGPLQSACLGKNYHIVRMLLEAGADVEARNGWQGTALQAAALCDHVEIARLLIQHGADVNAPGGQYGNPLTAAASRGSKRAVQLLVDEGAEVNAPGREGDNHIRVITAREDSEETTLERELSPDFTERNWTGLQAAACSGHYDIVQILIKNGADVNAQIGPLGTALQVACGEGHGDIVQLLIENGADVNAQAGFYGTALQAAAMAAHMSIIQQLLEKGADVSAPGGFHGSALLAACASRGNGMNAESILLLLIKKGANVNSQGGPFGNALQAASRAGNTRIVRALLENGADVNAQGGKFGNALQAAAHANHGEIVRLLIEKGASANVDDKYCAALQKALERSYKEVVRQLIRKGANVNKSGGHYGNVLQAASYGDFAMAIKLLSRKRDDRYLLDVSTEEHEQVVQFLIENGAKVNARGGCYDNALQAASCNGNIRVVKLLIEKGAKVNARGGYYGNALQAASHCGHEPVIRLLLANGAQVNAQGGFYGNALLAAAFHSTRVVELLVQNGADILGDDMQGRNLLHIAAVLGNCDVMRRWIDHGIDMTRRDRQGRTVLHHAASSGSVEAVKLVLAIPVDVNAVDRDGWTALHWASKRGANPVVKLLLDAGAEKATESLQGWMAHRVAIFHKHLSTALLLAGPSIPATAPSDSCLMPQAPRADPLSLAAPITIDAKDDQREPAVGFRHVGVSCDGCQLVSLTELFEH